MSEFRHKVNVVARDAANRRAMEASENVLAAACCEDIAEGIEPVGSVGLGLERTKLANTLSLLRTKRGLKVDEVEADAKSLNEDLMKQYQSKEECQELYDSIVASCVSALEAMKDPKYKVSKEHDCELEVARSLGARKHSH